MIMLFAIAFLCIGEEILLVRRCSQSFGKGSYSMVGGKVEQGESFLKAVAREVCEETTLVIPEDAFELMHIFHRKGTDTEFITLCFKVDIAHLPSPYNNEPDKHDDMRFFNVNELPVNILPAHKQAIECIQQNVSYSEHGWDSY